MIATYDAAIINKDANGKVHVSKREKPTQHGGWTGAAIGGARRPGLPTLDSRWGGGRSGGRGRGWAPGEGDVA